MGRSLIGGVAGDEAVSEFADKLLQWIMKTVYEGLYASVEKSIEGLFDFLNSELSFASRQIGLGPRLWNGGSGYETVQGIAENVCIPIAAAFITVIFCWELIHLVQESNNMNTVKPDRLLIIFLKFGLCLMVCAYSFKIVMGFCDIGIWAARAMRIETSVSISISPTLGDMGMSAELNVYELEDLIKLFGYFIMLKLAKLGRGDQRRY